MAVKEAVKVEKVSEVLERIHAQGMNTADDSTKVIPADLKVGTSVAQGDLNIWKLAKLPPDILPAVANAQLAPGTSRGSRHCIKAEDLHKVVFYRLANPNALHGPVLELKEEITIEHPEHGNQVWPAGIIAITYQRLHSVELKRNQD